MAQKVISTTILIAIMCQFSEQNPVSEPKNELLKETYAECNSKTSTCVGMPTGCVATQSCTVILSAKPTQTGADFMLHWTRDHSSMDKWVAAGISTDMKMGDDSVTECILRNNTMVKVRQGFTHCKKTDGNSDCGVDTVEPIKGITNETGTYSEDHVLTCSWSRAAETMVKAIDFNIQENKYYILLAYGPILNGEPLYHTSKWVSKEAFILGQEIGNSSTTPTVPTSNSTTAKPATTKGTTSPTSAQPTSSSKISTVTSTSISTTTDNTTMTGNTTITTMPSNTTSTAGNTTPHHSKTTTKPKNGSKTITYGLSLGIFVTIVLSLNL